MTAKEYLRQIHILDLKIKHKQLEKEMLMKKAYGVSAVTSDPNKVQTSASTEGPMRYIEKAADLEKTIDRMIDEYINLRDTIINQIHQLKDPRYIEILHERYVNCYSFELIAVNMNYSIRQIYQIHGDALQEFTAVNLT